MQQYHLENKITLSVRVYVCICMYMYVHVYEYFYVYVYIYIYIYLYIYWYEIIVILLNHSLFYLNYIFQMWLLLFNSFLVLYKVIKLPIIFIIYFYYFPFSNN